jgi:hypothetical protein
VVPRYALNYSTKHHASECIALPEDKQFTFFYEWLDRQSIFSDYGRVTLWINYPGAHSAVHTDYVDSSQPAPDEFIWIDFAPDRKKFYLVDDKTNQMLVRVDIGDNNIDYDAYQYFQKVIDNADPIYVKVPIFDRGLAGTGLNKKYISSEVRTNRLNEFFVGFNTTKVSTVKPNFPKLPKEKPHGYCIRSRTTIPFNPKIPLCQDAYKSWSKFSNPEYPEKYCHFSGEASNGETCVAKPILYKNWKQAKEVHGV